MKELPVSVTHIDVWVGRKTISSRSLEVHRNGVILWIITNKEARADLTVAIENFVPNTRTDPKDPVKTSGPLKLAHGATGVIVGLVHGVGQGEKTKVKYRYDLYIEDRYVDPEIVVCDDPEKDDRLSKKPKAPAPKTTKKAAKK